MAQYIEYKAESRGFADHGWLKSYHTFSFAGYFNEDRIHFGALRVLNDDYVAGGMGFGAHPHNNMEIVSIPLEGTLAHQDSMGSKGTIRKGEIQIMSAGTGVTHSEMNGDPTEAVKFLQIWLFPKEQNVTPRYGQMNYEVGSNEIKTLIQPTPSDDTLWLHQDAWFKMAKYDAHQSFEIPVEMPSQNGIYLFVLKGALTVDGKEVNTRDAIGVWDADKITIDTKEETEFLVIEVPMYELN